jgi:uncharacterized protein YndB with AHSA1/START domain
MSWQSSPVQFDLSCELGAPPEVVFSLLRDHAALPEWVPGLRSVEVDVAAAEVPGGAGTVRTLYPWLGSAGRETVLALEPPWRLAYSASDESLRGLYSAHLAELTCAASPAGTRLRWIVRARSSPRWWLRGTARLLFGLGLRGALRRLRRRFPIGATLRRD